MKNLKSPLFFSAILFAVVLLFAGCKTEVEEEFTGMEAFPLTANDKIIGTWESTYGEKYVISMTDYDNYYNNVLSYSTNSIVLRKTSESSGFIYGQFDDEDHLGYQASLGQWYALYYNNLTDESVNFFQPFKAGGILGANSLTEAINEFTIENGYYNFGSPSTCNKVTVSGVLNIAAIDNSGGMYKLIFENNKVTLQAPLISGWSDYDYFTPTRDTSKENSSVALYLYDSSERTYYTDYHYLTVSSTGQCYYYIYDDEEDDNDSFLEMMNEEDAYMINLSYSQINTLKNTY